ncbi:MAG: SAM-dependent methyltransferase [Micromonosporaceae bacterium]
MTDGKQLTPTFPGQERGQDPGAEADRALPNVDTSVPHIARIYDYWLGGKNNFAADREAAERALAAMPGIMPSVRANRAFLTRAVTYLAAEAGIRQFLDIGTGIPSANNTHEVAQKIAPGSRIVYVDNDPIVLAHARALLTSTQGGATAYIDADLRDPGKILRAAARTLDLTKPVAIMLVAILHCIPDDDDPLGIVARLLDGVRSGSYLVITHPVKDTDTGPLAQAAARMNEVMPQKVTPRTTAEVTRFFDGLELVPPGVVQSPLWRNRPGIKITYHDPMWGGVARKR